MNYNFQNEKCFRCQGTRIMLDEVNKESATCTYCNTTEAEAAGVPTQISTR